MLTTLHEDPRHAELDLLIVAGPSTRPVAHIRRTAIDHLPAVG